MTRLLRLQQVVRRFAVPGGIVVERREGSTVDAKGDPQRGALSTLRIDPAVMQPARGRDLLRFAEGDRGRDPQICHTLHPLRTAMEAEGGEADVIVYQPGGEDTRRRYVVTESGDWQTQAGFHRCGAVRQEAG